MKLYTGKSEKDAEDWRLKKRKASMKNKSAWRKKTNVADVEAFLEQKRQEERISGLESVKGDAGLFREDHKGASAAAHSARKKTKAARRAKPAEATVTVPVAEEEMQVPVKQQATKKKTLVVIVDPWASQGPSKADEQQIFEQLTKKAPVKRPQHLYKKRSELPSVEVAHPGASYNPTFDDHQAIMAHATEVEERKLRAVARTEKFFADMPHLDHVDRERIWMEEMSAGLDLERDGSGEEGSDSDEDDEDGSDDEVRGGEAAPAPKLVRAEFRKTKQQRRKEAERRQQAAEAREARLATLREQEVFRIRSLKKDLNQTEKTLEGKRKDRAEKAAKESTKTRKLGPHRYRAPDIEVQLSDELAGSLRKLKPEGSTLQDRFSSLQKRNVLEARKKVVPHHRLKQRFYTKNAYKEVPGRDQKQRKRR